MFRSKFAGAALTVAAASGLVGAYAVMGLNQPVKAQTKLVDDHVMKHVTNQFSGAKVNGGMATHLIENGKSILTLSDDFKVPGTPAPHWQVVDSAGNTYLLQRLVIKSDKFNKTITVPAYVKDIAKVQIWCAYAEVLLGEASFERPVESAMAR